MNTYRDEWNGISIGVQVSPKSVAQLDKEPDKMAK